MGCLCKESWGRIKQTSYSLFWAGSGFRLLTPLPHKTTRTTAQFYKCVTSESVNVLRSKVASNATPHVSEFQVLLDISPEISHYFFFFSPSLKEDSVFNIIYLFSFLSCPSEKRWSELPSLPILERKTYRFFPFCNSKNYVILQKVIL